MRQAAKAVRLPPEQRSASFTALDPMMLLCRAWGLPEPMREYRFERARLWRFDWAWPLRFVAVEQEGGIWTKGRHTRGEGFLNDLEKYNAATLAGWKVFRYTPQQIQDGAPLLVLRAVLA